MMICNLKQVIALSSALCIGSPILGGTFTWKPAGERMNDWNWCEGGNFIGGVAPYGNGSIVVIPDNTRVVLRADDSNSRTVVNALSLVSTDGWNATMEIEVAADEINPFTLTPQVRYGGADGSSDATGAGRLVKTGGGTLILSDNDGHAYQVACEVVAGAVKMSPTAKTQSNYYVSTLAVSNGATFFYAPNTAWTRCGRVSGTGTITTDSPGSPFCLTGGTIQDPNIVEAYMAPGSSVWVGAYVRLVCPTNANTSCFVYNHVSKSAASGGSVVEFPALGEPGQPSYLGALTYLQPSTKGGFFRYVGMDDATCGYKMAVGYPKEGPAGFDAGPHGGVTFTNNWSASGNDAACAFYLLGSNTYPCIVACNTGPTLSFVKAGTGVWRFADGATRSNCGGFSVDEGTLQFDSIAEAGSACSLGLATMLFPRGFYGDTATASQVDYAFTLGNTGTTGTLEYTGAKAIHVKTRSIAMIGDGRLVDSVKGATTNQHLHVGLHSGVKSITNGLHRLILDGTNSNGDEISGITDGEAGRIGLVKRGSGMWRVCGDCSFTGPIEVEEGTLRLAGPHYTWYRLTVTANMSRDYSMTSNELQMDELGLFDKDGFRQNLNLVRIKDEIVKTASQQMFGGFLRPGEAAYADVIFYPDTPAGPIYYGYDTVNDVEALFNGTTDDHLNYMKYGTKVINGGYSVPLSTEPMRLTFRLPENAKPVTSYDIVTFRNASTDVNSYIKHPKAWTLEGSVNGKDWALLHTMANAATDNPDPEQILKIAGAHRWMGGERATFTAADGVTTPHTCGQPITSMPSNAQPLYQNIDYVSVAAGATLVAEGEITLKKLKVDYDKGVGTLVDFNFAEGDDGTIIVENIPNEHSVTLPGTYDRNVGGWTLASSDPKTARRRLIMRADGRISLMKHGTVMSFK